MIKLYYWPTQNCRKITIALIELGLDYKIEVVNLKKKEQMSQSFRQLNPIHKLPVIVDSNSCAQEETVIFESGAILVYLAEKTGKLLPASQQLRFRAISWMLVQLSSLGPIFGQRNHYEYAEEKVAYALDKARADSDYLLDILDAHLINLSYFVDEYSIADISMFPWIHSNAARHGIIQLESRPNLSRWFWRVASRPAVQQGMKVLSELSWDNAGLDALPLEAS